MIIAVHFSWYLLFFFLILFNICIWLYNWMVFKQLNYWSSWLIYKILCVRQLTTTLLFWSLLNPLFVCLWNVKYAWLLLNCKNVYKSNKHIDVVIQMFKLLFSFSKYNHTDYLFCRYTMTVDGYHGVVIFLLMFLTQGKCIIQIL